MQIIIGIGRSMNVLLFIMQIATLQLSHYGLVIKLVLECRLYGDKSMSTLEHHHQRLRMV